MIDVLQDKGIAKSSLTDPALTIPTRKPLKTLRGESTGMTTILLFNLRLHVQRCRLL